MDILRQLGWYIQVNRRELVCRLERVLSVLKLVILQRLVGCVYKGVIFPGKFYTVKVVKNIG